MIEAIVAQILGTAASAYGAIYEGQVNADIAEYNAKIADQNADIVTRQGAEASRRSLVNSSKVIGQAEAEYGAAGVSGVSAQMVLRNSAAQGALDALTIEYGAELKANAFRNEAALDRYRAENSRKAGYIGAASSILKGGSGLNLGGD